MLVRGGARAYAPTGNRVFEQDDPGIPGTKRPGNAFGAAVTLSRVSPTRLDLAIGAPGEGEGGTVWVLTAITPALGATGTRRIALSALGGAPEGLTLAG